MASNEPQARAERLVGDMLRRDSFSAWLGIELLELAPGRCRARMRVREEMLNGFGVAHGGIAFSLADSAFAFASNTHGTVTVAVENSIGYPAPVRRGDTLTATAEEESAGRRLGYYRVIVRNQDEVTVAIFRGTAYRTSRELAGDDAPPLSTQRPDHG